MNVPFGGLFAITMDVWTKNDDRFIVFICIGYWKRPIIPTSSDPFRPSAISRSIVFEQPITK